jgi:hypothetical protein
MYTTDILGVSWAEKKLGHTRKFVLILYRVAKNKKNIFGDSPTVAKRATAWKSPIFIFGHTRKFVQRCQEYKKYFGRFHNHRRLPSDKNSPF